MILIAGGTGRLGTLLTTRLVGHGLPVRVLTRDLARAGHLISLGAQVVTGDVRDPATLEAAVRDADVVVSAVHGFGGPGGVSPATVDYRGNVNLIDAAQVAGADVVLMSVVGAAADSPMELHRMKHAAERHLLASGARSTIVRATAFLELWIEILNQTAARSGRPVVFGHGTNPVNFVSVTDVAALVERVIADQESRGSIFEIGGPDDLTFSQLAAAVQAAAGRSATPRHVPRSILRLAAGTVGRIRPAAGRQIRAALFMDAADLSFGTGASRDHYPGIPLTSLGDCLQPRVIACDQARP